MEWIESNSNLADGLSRKGLADPLSGAVALVASCPAWQPPTDLSLQSLAVLQAGCPAGHHRLLCTLGVYVGGCWSRFASPASCCRCFRIPTCMTCWGPRPMRITEVHSFTTMIRKKRKTSHTYIPAHRFEPVFGGWLENGLTRIFRYRDVMLSAATDGQDCIWLEL